MKTENTHPAGFTPGPFTLREVPALDGSGAIAHEIEIEGHTVAHVYPDTGENYATLLASAPELLEALKACLTWAETYQRLNLTHPDGPLAQNIQIARAVIARATEGNA